MSDNEKISPPDDFEVLKFMMECSYKEAALFWNRNSVFLLVNLASLSAALAYFSNEETVQAVVRVGIGAFGFLICLIWIFVIRAGRAMNHAWTEQAKELALKIRLPELITALGNTPSEGAYKQEADDSARKKGKQLNLKSTTSLMYWVAGLFGLAWFLIAILGSKIF